MATLFIVGAAWLGFWFCVAFLVAGVYASVRQGIKSWRAWRVRGELRAVARETFSELR